MAGIQLTLSNMMQLASLLSPVLLAFFFVMLSILNQNIKGLVYIAGVLLATVLNIPIMNLIKSPISPDASLTCNLVEIPFLTNYNSPAPSSLLIAFTFAYLFLPMKANNQMNFSVISALCILFAMDAVTRITGKCTTVSGTVIGGLVGVIFGTIWYTVFHAVGADYLLYFDELESNNVVCSKPSKQKFKCSVFKNGQLISSNIA
jgi:hypothetical protein